MRPAHQDQGSVPWTLGQPADIKGREFVAVDDSPSSTADGQQVA
ncbi:MAG: hypothetical protein U0894_14165 [Pirellulales bacterium]